MLLGTHVQTLWGVLTLRSARQMALLHLKPEPKAICQTLSPRRTPIFVSILASTYLQPAQLAHQRGKRIAWSSFCQTT